MQILAQDLSEYELNLGVGCAKGNTEANGFTPQDWTGKYEPYREKNLSMGFLTRSDTNWAVQQQKMDGGLKFWIRK